MVDSSNHCSPKQPKYRSAKFSIRWSVPWTIFLTADTLNSICSTCLMAAAPLIRMAGRPLFRITDSPYSPCAESPKARTVLLPNGRSGEWPKLPMADIQNVSVSGTADPPNTHPQNHGVPERPIPQKVDTPNRRSAECYIYQLADQHNSRSDKWIAER